MAKKSKEKKPAEFYKSIIRKQKKQIQDLSKKAARGNKVKERYEELESELVDQLLEAEMEDTVVYDDNSCTECLKGKLEEIPLGIRKMIICSNCNYRKVIK
jgi:hypothetical protein